MAEDSGNPDYLVLSLRSIHKTNGLVRGGTLEFNENLCKNIISHELQVVHDFLMFYWEKLVVKDMIKDRRRVALLQLYAVVKQGEILVRQCCESSDSTWPERAVSLRAIKEDVLDIVLHLRWWTSILDMAIETAMSQLPNSPSVLHHESKRLDRANREFEETLKVMALFDIMDSSMDEIQRLKFLKNRMDTLQRIQENHGVGYTGELGTKEHLEFILSWNYEESVSLTPTSRGLGDIAASHFKEVLIRCIELQNAAAEDKKHLVNKASDVMGSFTGESGSREHHAYVLANQVYSILTDAEVDGIPELNEYNVKCTIGKGAFGVVNRVTWCGLDCVLKQTFDNPNDPEERNEAKCLKRFSHPHIVKFYRHFVASPGGDENHPPQSHIVMEQMPIDLGKHMKNLKESRSSSLNPSSSSGIVPFSEPVAVDIMLQLAKAMWHMHSKYVVHRDLKPANILVKPVSQKELPELFDRGYVQVKLGDFGLVRENMLSSHSQLLSHKAGTSLYRAPELSLPNFTAQKWKGGEKRVVPIKYPHRADLWSFGMMSSEILSGETPFSNEVQRGVLLEDIQNNARPRIPEDCPDYLRFCIESCWKYEPLERPKFSDIWRMLRIAKLRSLGLIINNFDWFTYKDRCNHVVGINTGSVLSQMQLEKTSKSSRSKAAKGNFSFLLSVFLKFKMFGGTKPTLAQDLGIHFKSPHRQPFGYLTNKVWPRDSKVTDWKLDVIFFEGNVGGRESLSCRDTWLQRNQPKVFWPRDWLPQDVHNKDIRVLVLEYSISEKGLDGLVSDIKKFLIFSDRWNQHGTWSRPIVLVGHSLGCSVIESLVLDLDHTAWNFGDSFGGPTSDQYEKTRDISRAFMYSLRGCFFYSYPSYGLVRGHSFLKEIFRGLTYSNDLFEEEFWEGSMKLQKRSTNFLRMAEGRNSQIRVMSMIEGCQVKGSFVVARLLNPPECDLSIENTVVLPDTNHIATCKPVDRHSPAYQELVKFLIINSKERQIGENGGVDSAICTPQ